MSFPSGSRIRADELVFRQGLCESREQAKRLIMAAKVAFCPGEGHPPVIVPKPGHPYPAGSEFLLVGQERFVSRGAYKLLTALEHFRLASRVEGAVCLDAGASTGGFTDCLLQHGAARVYAVDVGHAQLHEKLRADARVVSREGVNLRTAEANLLPEPVAIIVADVSFISLALVLPACLRWLEPDGFAVGLIKPQFEAGPRRTRKGVVREESARREAVDKVLEAMHAHGLACRGVIPAAIKGPKGNQEYLALWERARPGEDAPRAAETFLPREEDGHED